MVRAAAEPATAARATRLETCIVLGVVWDCLAESTRLQKYKSEELFGRRGRKSVEICGTGNK